MVGDSMLHKVGGRGIRALLRALRKYAIQSVAYCEVVRDQGGS